MRGEGGGVMSELVPGGNLPLPGGAVTVRVPGPFDVSALVTGRRRQGRGRRRLRVLQPAVRARRPALRGDALTVDPRDCAPARRGSRWS